MRLPNHIALGRHDNWGRLFVSRWHCKSLRHVFGVGACSVHHSATGQLYLELSAVPIIAWHRHPYLFSRKFIIYDTSSFLPWGTWMLLSCWSEIWLGSCYLSRSFEVIFFKCPSIVAIMYHRPTEQTYSEPDNTIIFGQQGNSKGLFQCCACVWSQTETFHGFHGWLKKTAAGRR